MTDFKNKYFLSALWISSFLFVSCMNEPSERVKLDMKTGKYTDENIEISVQDGLGVIKEVAPAGVSIRSSAPKISISVTNKTSVDKPFLLLLSNVPKDTEITKIECNSGIIPDATGLNTDVVTDKSWSLVLPPSDTCEIFTAPLNYNEIKTFRFAVFSDIQEGVDGIGDIINLINADSSILFVVSAGDLTYRGTEEEMKYFQLRLREMNVPFYSTSGNHDVGWGHERIWYSYVGRNSFHFEFAGVSFSFADSSDATIDPTVYKWLENWLNQSKQSVHIFISHIPPIDPVGTRNASFMSRAEAGKLISMLVKGKVDLALYGHIHSYYSFSNGGIPSYISGGGGGPDEHYDGIGRHFLVVDVDPETGILNVGVVRVDK